MTKNQAIKFFSMPKVYREFTTNWEQKQKRAGCLETYQTGRLSFISNLLPEHVLKLTVAETLAILRARLGEKFKVAFDHLGCVESPVAKCEDSRWITRSNVVGVNIRTLGSLWDVVKYALTLPAMYDAIHFLPIWEPGVVGSLYGVSSWQLNSEFYSPELAEAVPELDTIEKQLKVTIQLLHAMGKTVGMDVIPHMDRFSEIVLAFPEFFEWLQRQDTAIISHRADLHEEVQEKIFEFLVANGPALEDEPFPFSHDQFFSTTLTEKNRLRILFGLPENQLGRNCRRNELIAHLCLYGYEPVPATMGVPFRGIQVDLQQDIKIIDRHTHVWRDYVFQNPGSMSRVFGPLTRYKLYERKDDNHTWQIDFDRPRIAVWDYLCAHYQQIQQNYGFDFMRGDMSHVQMRPDGASKSVDTYYDLLGSIKKYIQKQGCPYFGYFAESFLAARDVFGYGEEIDHLEASDADVTLGNLQSTVVGSHEFLQIFRRYCDYKDSRLCIPSFTVITGDKDDPRFDKFYIHGNLVRLFISLLLTDMPSYTALGFETRDIHHQPYANECYSKLYVFQESQKDKKTQGSYRWGKNAFQFYAITKLRLCLEKIWPELADQDTRWLLAPDATGANPVLAWTQRQNPRYIFVVNTSGVSDVGYFSIPQISRKCGMTALRLVYSSEEKVNEFDAKLGFNKKHYRIHSMKTSEARIYALS